MKWLNTIGGIFGTAVFAYAITSMSYQRGFEAGLKTAQEIISSYSDIMQNGINVQKELQKTK